MCEPPPLLREPLLWLPPLERAGADCRVACCRGADWRLANDWVARCVLRCVDCRGAENECARDVFCRAEAELDGRENVLVERAALLWLRIALEDCVLAGRAKVDDR